MKTDFAAAIAQISAERGVAQELVMETIKAAVVSAYKRSFGPSENVSVRIDPGTGEPQVFIHKTAVEDVTNPSSEISLKEARAIKPNVQIGDEIEIESTPKNFGRIAAQTAKQVVLQRIREAEREHIYDEYIDREGEIITGVVQRYEGRTIILELGKAEAVLPPEEQVPAERYRLGQRLKVLLLEVSKTHRGPQLVVSRTHRNLLKRLFELEVPEIYNGIVEIKSIAREPGLRSKVAVTARQEGIDPVGSCVGMRGIRIQNVVNELYGEKIDVVEWDASSATYIANALSPAQVVSVDLNDAEKTATVIVPERQLSLAIGKEGQNARLAAKLTGWKIDIKSAVSALKDQDDDFARRALEALREGSAWGSADSSSIGEPIKQVTWTGKEETRRVRKDGTISFGAAIYGPLPDNLAGKTVKVRQTDGRLEVFWGDHMVGTYEPQAPVADSDRDEKASGRREKRKVQKGASVTYQGVSYKPLPDGLVGETVEIANTGSAVQVYRDAQLVAEFERKS